MRGRRTVVVGEYDFAASRNKKNATITDEQLADIFAGVGARHGYADVKAHFEELGDFKVRWQRTYRWIDFSISDYLDRAPPRALENLAESLFDRLEGKETDCGEEFLTYLADRKVVRANQRDYIQRKGLATKTIGTYHDLNDCVARLRSQGLIKAATFKLVWNDSFRMGGKASACSVLNKVIEVNTLLDEKGVPEYVLDYAVYVMACYIEIGFQAGRMDEMKHQKMVRKYPMCDEAVAWLQSNGFFI